MPVRKKIAVEVEFDPRYLTNAELIEECRERNIAVVEDKDDMNTLEIIRDMILAKKYQDALVLIERRMSPPKDIAARYEAAKRNRDAFGRPAVK